MNTYRFSKKIEVDVTAIVDAESPEEALEKIEAEGADLDNFAGNGGTTRLLGFYPGTIDLSIEPSDEVCFEKEDLVETEDD